MVEVKANRKYVERESVDILLRKLKTKCFKEGIYDEVKKREYYMSPSVKRNLERN